MELDVEKLKGLVGTLRQSVKLNTDLKAKAEKAAAAMPTPAEVDAAVQALIVNEWMDPGAKEAAVRALADPKQALVTLINLAVEANEQVKKASGQLPGQTPGRPAKSASARSATDVLTGPIGPSYDDSSRSFNEELSKLAALSPELN